jgi:hypothetical protein
MKMSTMMMRNACSTNWSRKKKPTGSGRTDAARHG